MAILFSSFFSEKNYLCKIYIRNKDLSPYKELQDPTVGINDLVRTSDVRVIFILVLKVKVNTLIAK